MRNFLVIGGPPRSGTRFITTALNAHSDIVVQGEPHPVILSQSIDYFKSVNMLYKKIDESLNDTQAGSKLWKNKRADIFYRMVCAGQKISTRPTPKGTTYVGFKLPRVEHSAVEISRIVGSYSFLYCLRNFDAHFLSCWNRWGTPIEKIADRYRGSINTALDLLERDKPNLVAFSLDRMKSDPLQHLFEVATRLSIPDAETWVKSVNPDMRANQAEKFVSQKRASLNDDEVAFMRENADLYELHDTFWKAYDGASR